MKILFIVGARPNFIKVSALVEAAKKQKDLDYILIHTGQHFDAEMSKVFFDELNLPKPKYNLGVGKSEAGAQELEIVQKLTPIFYEEKPNAIVVVGDVTSTLAGAVAAKIAKIPLVHVEAGLRSNNWSMLEERNRFLVDHLSDYLFASEPAAEINLKAERVKGKIFFVGNIMIDTLNRFLDASQNSDIIQNLKLQPKNYAVLTLHRAENVDSASLIPALQVISRIAKEVPIIFPVHPRTREKILERFGNNFFEQLKPKIQCAHPLGYVEFLALMKNARVVLTDSGGIQEETTVLNVPCLTLRNETERPLTVIAGTNELVGMNAEKIENYLKDIFNGKWKHKKDLPLWDGHAAERIINILYNEFQK